MKSGITWSIVLMLLGVALAALVAVKGWSRWQRIETSVELAPGNAAGLTTGTPVHLEAQIHKDTRVLSDGLVIGVEEQRDDEGSWHAQERYLQSIPFALEDGTTVQVKFVHPTPDGSHHEVTLGASKRKRGYLRETQLAMVGTVSATEPLSMEVHDHFGGSMHDFKAHLMPRRAVLLSGSLVGAGLLLLLLTLLWRRRQRRKAGT